ncbi:hypothetical protein J8J14_12210 [Roseomonas sp. SSH11]|uniref:DUF2946 domain-containing protein n=1 Tax=Pararoseomonas baculiformis TaxID=2820812 RepID=A0ABS4AG84_9PROT|nr:DUF2946 family protein [Pararoseomonas baculiformis]MBP0445540.1 hypothetical protein [Pararoseomonas baculiformis]
MRRLRPGLARLLPLLLLLQWGAATVPHARALERLGGAMLLELCSPHGARSLLVDEEGQPIQRDAAQDCCTLCLAPAAAPPPVSCAPPRPVGYVVLAAAPDRPGLPPLPPRAPPQLPRAPPIL